VTLQEVEARLRREPGLDKLEANVVQALARAVMGLLKASMLNSGTSRGGFVARLR
jgi:hypothetical protein